LKLAYLSAALVGLTGFRHDEKVGHEAANSEYCNAY
jgi:hypothetical protein